MAAPCLLDEIGEMPLATQAKLLRVLEDSKVRRLGSKSEISVDVRVLAATNKIPQEAVAQGQLRSDLYFRLNVVQVAMPPLREHLDDLADLAAALLEGLNRKHGRSVKGHFPRGAGGPAAPHLAGKRARAPQCPGTGLGDLFRRDPGKRKPGPRLWPARLCRARTTACACGRE